MAGIVGIWIALVLWSAHCAILTFNLRHLSVLPKLSIATPSDRKFSQSPDKLTVSLPRQSVPVWRVVVCLEIWPANENPQRRAVLILEVMWKELKGASLPLLMLCISANVWSRYTLGKTLGTSCPFVGPSTSEPGIPVHLMLATSAFICLCRDQNHASTIFCTFCTWPQETPKGFAL